MSVTHCQPESLRAAAPRGRTRCEPLFDDADADLRAIAWYVGAHGYARRSCRTWKGHGRAGTLVSRTAHRVVMERVIGRPLASAECCDHINHNRLDNRRSNLRVVTHARNCQHRRGANKGNPTGYRGVSWVAARNSWEATVRHNGRKHNLGYFDTPEAAAMAAYGRRRELGFPAEPPPVTTLDSDGRTERT